MRKSLFCQKRCRNKFGKTLLNIFFVTISLALVGCQSTKLNDRTQFLADGLEINAQDDVFKIYDTDFKDDFKKGDKFIFLRLYYPNYTNKISDVNFLKWLITAVEPTNKLISHTSIGFDLNDNFYGLTTYKPQCLKLESCIDTSTNKYMKMCNKYTSFQVTLAIKVSEEEYQTTKEFLEKDYAEGSVNYYIPKNLKIGIHSLKRKNQKSTDKKILGGTPSKDGYANPQEETSQNFVCSSYIAYVLAKNIQSVNNFFIEKDLNYHDTIPTDLFFIPGVKILFVSTWVDYEIAAEEFVKSEPLFAEYLSN